MSMRSVIAFAVITGFVLGVADSRRAHSAPLVETPPRPPYAAVAPR
jgi:hypothetical protein